MLWPRTKNLFSWNLIFVLVPQWVCYYITSLVAQWIWNCVCVAMPNFCPRRRWAQKKKKEDELFHKVCHWFLFALWYVYLFRFSFIPSSFGAFHFAQESNKKKKHWRKTDGFVVMMMIVCLSLYLSLYARTVSFVWCDARWQWCTRQWQFDSIDYV